ncbi:MAG: class I SAM-dependent methyltransferase [Egibacteraceae bacterium]
MTRAEILLSPQGLKLLDRLAGQELASDTSLRLGVELRRAYPAELVAAALTQHELRLKARAKFTRAMRMLFTRPGLEQASSELTARHRARRYTGARHIADLCAGIGGDLVALAPGKAALAVDLDPLHLRMAKLNAEVYEVGDAVTTVRADVRDVDLADIDAVFIDPARRLGDRRLGGGQSEPPLDWCLSLAERVPAVGIKTAPGLAHERVPAGWELEFVADRRDLKEAVLWSPALATTARRATILPAGDTLRSTPGPVVDVRPPGAFLLDPNPAVTRAGLVEELARTLDAWKIDRQIAFLSAPGEVRSPFARTLRVVESAPWNEKRFAQRLRALGIGAVDIRRRGLAGDVDQIHHRLQLQGDRRATVVITRAQDHPGGRIAPGG